MLFGLIGIIMSMSQKKIQPPSTYWTAILHAGLIFHHPDGFEPPYLCEVCTLCRSAEKSQNADNKVSAIAESSINAVGSKSLSGKREHDYVKISD